METSINMTKAFDRVTEIEGEPSTESVNVEIPAHVNASEVYMAGAFDRCWSNVVYKQTCKPTALKNSQVNMTIALDRAVSGNTTQANEVPSMTWAAGNAYGGGSLESNSVVFG